MTDPILIAPLILAAIAVGAFALGLAVALYVVEHR
jgi:hypothetical protein